MKNLVLVSKAILLLVTLNGDLNDSTSTTAFVIVPLDLTTYNSRFVAPNIPSSTTATSSSQLFMGNNNNGFIVDRITRVVKSNVNKFVSNIENPEKVINQSVTDMQVRFVKSFASL
jgi:hypothetical protein